MYRLGADHTGLLSNSHRLARQNPPVDAAYRCKPQKAALLDIGYDQTNLVHMRRKKHRMYRLLPPLFERKDVAQRVNPIDAVPFNLLENLVPDRFFSAGYPRKPTEGF